MSDTDDDAVASAADRDQAELQAMAERAGLDVERDRLTLETYRALISDVTGPDNPVWAVQGEICRQVLAKGGIPVEELECHAPLKPDRPVLWYRPAVLETAATKAQKFVERTSRPLQRDIGKFVSFFARGHLSVGDTPSPRRTSTHPLRMFRHVTAVPEVAPDAVRAVSHDHEPGALHHRLSAPRPADISAPIYRLCQVRV